MCCMLGEHGDPASSITDKILLWHKEETEKCHINPIIISLQYCQSLQWTGWWTCLHYHVTLGESERWRSCPTNCFCNLAATQQWASLSVQQEATKWYPTGPVRIHYQCGNTLQNCITHFECESELACRHESIVLHTFTKDWKTSNLGVQWELFKQDLSWRWSHICKISVLPQATPSSNCFWTTKAPRNTTCP